MAFNKKEFNRKITFKDPESFRNAYDETPLHKKLTNLSINGNYSFILNVKY